MTTSPAIGRRDRKKLETRAALSAAALRLVAEHGLEHVTVEQISEACDVSSRTFFNYFASKDEAVVGDVGALDRVLELFRALPADTGVIEALRLAFIPLLHEMEDHRETVALRIRVITENPHLMPRLMAASGESELAIAEAVAQRLGLPSDDLYPPVVAAATGAAFRVALTRWATAETPTATLAKLLDEAFGMVAAGLDAPHRSPL